MRSIDALVGRVEPRVGDDGFAAAAEAALEEVAPPALGEVLDWLAATDAVPLQDLASGFGEPPVTLYAGDGWGVQLLCWARGRTAVHEHDFEGAFRVLRGSSVQRLFRYEAELPRGAPLRLGALEPTEVELLGTGDVRRIDPGAQMIHSVYHLEPATLTLVVRRDSDSGGPQYDYWGPSVALDPEHVDPRVERQVALLGLLMSCGPKEPSLAWIGRAAQALDGADLHATFRVLDLIVGQLAGGPLPDPVRDAAREAHGSEAIDAILASIGRARWEHRTDLDRHRVSGADAGFLIAALLNAASAEDVMSLLGARYGEDRATARDRARRGLVALASSQSPQLAPLVDAVAGRLLKGEPREEVRAALEASPHRALAAQLGGSVEGFLDGLAAGPMRPLLACTR